MKRISSAKVNSDVHNQTDGALADDGRGSFRDPEPAQVTNLLII